MRHVRGFQTLCTVPIDDGDSIASMSGSEALNTIYLTSRKGRTFRVDFETGEIEETHLGPK